MADSLPIWGAWTIAGFVGLIALTFLFICRPAQHSVTAAPSGSLDVPYDPSEMRLLADDILQSVNEIESAVIRTRTKKEIFRRARYSSSAAGLDKAATLSTEDLISHAIGGLALAGIGKMGDRFLSIPSPPPNYLKAYKTLDNMMYYLDEIMASQVLWEREHRQGSVPGVPFDLRFDEPQWFDGDLNTIKTSAIMIRSDHEDLGLLLPLKPKP